LRTLYLAFRALCQRVAPILALDGFVLIEITPEI